MKIQSDAKRINVIETTVTALDNGDKVSITLLCMCALPLFPQCTYKPICETIYSMLLCTLHRILFLIGEACVEIGKCDWKDDGIDEGYPRGGAI